MCTLATKNWRQRKAAEGSPKIRSNRRPRKKTTTSLQTRDRPDGKLTRHEPTDGYLLQQSRSRFFPLNTQMATGNDNEREGSSQTERAVRTIEEDTKQRFTLAMENDNAQITADLTNSNLENLGKIARRHHNHVKSVLERGRQQRDPRHRRRRLLLQPQPASAATSLLETLYSNLGLATTDPLMAAAPYRDSPAPTKTMSRATRLRCLLLSVLALVVALCLSCPLQQVSCQLYNSEPPPPASMLAMESRGVPNSANQANTHLPINNAALDQLVNFLTSYNNQQTAANNNQRRSPAVVSQSLPLGAMGNQRQLPHSQPPASSTPVNPYAAVVNFQPTRRQQSPPQPFPQNSQGPFNQASSSPSPPPMTLNRLANQFGGLQQPGLNMNQNNRFTNSQQLPALSTMPLSGNFVNNGPQQSRLLVPQRNFVRPQQVNSGGAQFGQTLRSPLMPPPTGSPSSNQQQQPKPMTGFAPSGPPPGSASNNAISVVQSPSNAIGQHSPAMQVSSPFEMPLFSNGANKSTTTAATPTTTTSTTTSTTTTAATTTSATSDAVMTTKQTPTGVTSPTTTASSSRPVSEESPTTVVVSASSTSHSDNEHTSPASTGSKATSSSSSSESSNSESDSLAALTTTESIWNPVSSQANRTRASTGLSSLAPSPDIVTVPPGYNPDQPMGPQNYDIPVTAQMGGSSSRGSPVVGLQPESANGGQQQGTSGVEPTPSLASQASVLVAAAPTETTTIIWSSETQHEPTATHLVNPTRVATNLPIQSTRAATAAPNQQQAAPSMGPSRIRDVMMQNDEAQTASDSIVYGKAANRDAKPKSPDAGGQQPSGKPFIQTAQLDNQVRPYSAGSQQLLKSNHGSSSLPFKPSRPLNGNGGNGAGSGMSVGSGFSIVASGNQTMPTGDIQDYVANAPPPIVSLGASSGQHQTSNSAEPTISAQGGPDPASFDLAPEASSAVSTASSAGNNRQQQQQNSASDTVASSTPSTLRLRRPTFKPKPAVPPIRIDSCIVGDDTSCDQSHNERCVTEYGISSCHCKPGFARLSQLRGFCSPVSLVQFNMKIDKLSDDRLLAFNQSLENPNSEEYQYLEFETIQALASAMQQTSLAKQFMGARLNKFYHDKRNKIWANISMNLDLNNVTKNEQKIQELAKQELGRLVQQRQRQPLGESTIVLDGSASSISRLTDVNECASKELNDCSKHATCTNEFGGYSCQCLAGYEDKSLQGSSSSTTSQMSEEEKLIAKAKQGRVCMGCSPAYCSNRGECSIADGKKQCKCRANFIGARCDIDSEVLAVAIGGSLVGLIILIVTFWCLFVFNRRWRREQQKMDAMSATSGLTYNYVNSNNNSTNSLMSPLGRSQNPQHLGGVVSGRSAAYTVGQRFSSVGNGLSSRQYHADQQAIIGSTSSGSSAASQPIACNPYVAGYSYDEGLLIAPASTGSSEQTSPSANSYRGIMGASNTNHSAAMLAAAVNNAYTLSGHHHHHHGHHHQHLLQQQQLASHHMHHHHAGGGGKQLSQFHPSALMDSYATRTLNTQSANYCPSQQTANGYDSRWRTLQQADNSTAKQSSLAGYYLVR